MNDTQSPEAYQARRRLQEKHRNGNGAGLVLAQASKMWVTPSSALATGGQTSRSGDRIDEPLLAGQAIRLSKTWPSPNATDFKSSAQVGQRRGQLSEAAEQLWNRKAFGGGPRVGMHRFNPSSFDQPRNGNVEEDVGMWLLTSGRLGQRTEPDGKRTSQDIRVLSPLFTEVLMGWRPGWTDCASVETGSCRNRPASRGRCSCSA
jgi:hypothetical protein